MQALSATSKGRQSAQLWTTVLVVFCLSSTAPFTSAQWDNHGGGIWNRREAVPGSRITRTSISTLALKWSLNASNEITATPSVADGVLYFPTWTDGNVYAVCASTGDIIWTQNVSLITGLSGSFVRPTPTIAGDLLLLGIYSPGVVVALHRGNGSLAWQQTLDENPAAQITMGGTAFSGAFYVGVSSKEESQYANNCCTFQGSMQKLDLRTGKQLWKTLMLPPNNGSTEQYSGAALWGSSPAIDRDRKLVLIATGNDYTVPAAINACEEARRNMSNPPEPDPCIKPYDHQNSVMALHLETGDVIWVTHLGDFDTYNNACKQKGNPYCPPIAGKDYDFGECPMLLRVMDRNGTARDIAAVAQKSGVVWALDRDSGEVLWATLAGPGATPGGATWGSATDGVRIYVNILNSNGLNYTLYPSTEITTGGAWVGVNASTGDILWTTAVPGGYPAHGPVSVSDGVVFVGSGGPAGGVYGLDAETGMFLWNATTEGTVFGGFSLDRSCAYVGSGVNPSYFGRNTTAGHTVYAYCVECDEGF